MLGECRVHIRNLRRFKWVSSKSTVTEVSNCGSPPPVLGRSYLVDEDRMDLVGIEVDDERVQCAGSVFRALDVF